MDYEYWLERARVAQMEVDNLSRRLSALRAERDAFLSEARNAGATWVEMQKAAHMTPSALRKALGPRKSG